MEAARNMGKRNRQKTSLASPVAVLQHQFKDPCFLKAFQVHVMVSLVAEASWLVPDFEFALCAPTSRLESI